jgi:hypothetical protein
MADRIDAALLELSEIYEGFLWQLIEVRDEWGTRHLLRRIFIFGPTAVENLDQLETAIIRSDGNPANVTECRPVGDEPIIAITSHHCAAFLINGIFSEIVEDIPFPGGVADLTAELSAWIDDNFDALSEWIAGVEFDKEEIARLACHVYRERSLLTGIEPVDGPIANGFRFKGIDHSGLDGKPWHLLNCLWRLDGRTCGFDDLAGQVWGDHERDVTSDMVGSLRRSANRFFLNKLIPFEVSTSGRTVNLFCTK